MIDTLMSSDESLTCSSSILMISGLTTSCSCWLSCGCGE